MQITASRPIVVMAIIPVTITAPDKAYATRGFPVMLTFGGTPPYNIAIDRGDGRPIQYIMGHLVNTWSNPSVQPYPSTGVYPITVEVEDSDMNTGSVAHEVMVEDMLTCSLEVDNANPIAGEEVTFTLSMGGGYLDYSWELDFGDETSKVTGVASTDPHSATQKHTYTEGGSYTAILKVTDNLGVTSYSLVSIPISIRDSLVAGWNTLSTAWNNLTRWQKVAVTSIAAVGVAVGAHISTRK